MVEYCQDVAEGTETKSTRQDAKRKLLTKIEYFASPTPELCQWAKRDFQKLKHQIAKRLERFSKL